MQNYKQLISGKGLILLLNMQMKDLPKGYFPIINNYVQYKQKWYCGKQKMVDWKVGAE